MQLEFLNSVVDIRGRILFCKYGDLSFNILETKKGFSRGGHFHNFHSTHYLIKGKIIFKTFDLNSKNEQITKFFAPSEINVSANIAHILTALTDSIFIEFFDQKYSAIDYLPYRNLIKGQLENS